VKDKPSVQIEIGRTNWCRG